jgi:hypothetical protein
MSSFLLISFLWQDQAATALVVVLMRLPPHAVLYGIASVVHLLRWKRLIPWVYLGLALASLALS